MSNKLAVLTPSLFVDQLMRRGIPPIMWRFRVHGGYEVDGVEKEYLEHLNHRALLPDGAYIEKEEIDAKRDMSNLDYQPIFFEALLGPIFYRGNCMTGYNWSLKRPLHTYAEVLTAYSMGREIHDLWGDIDDLLYKHGEQITLRSHLTIWNNDPPSSSIDAFLYLHNTFGEDVFQLPKWEDLERFKTRNHYDIVDAFDLKRIFQKRQKRITRRSDSLKTTDDPKSAIYSEEVHRVIWGVTQDAVIVRPDIRFAIDSWGFPMRVKQLKNGSFLIEDYKKIGGIYVQKKERKSKGTDDEKDEGLDLRVDFGREYDERDEYFEEELDDITDEFVYYSEEDNRDESKSNENDDNKPDNEQ